MLLSFEDAFGDVGEARFDDGDVCLDVGGVFFDVGDLGFDVAKVGDDDVVDVGVGAWLVGSLCVGRCTSCGLFKNTTQFGSVSLSLN